MKKFLLGLGIVLLTAGVAFASPINKTIIAQTTLDDSPTSVTSATQDVQDFLKTGFVIEYDETEVGGGVSGTVSFEFSYDGTNWTTGYFYDFAGGSTAQTQETLAADATYICWLDSSLWSIPYARATVAGTNTDTDDTIVVTVYMTGQQ